MSFCSFAFAFTFSDEHGQIDKIFRLTTTTEGDHKGRPYGEIMESSVLGMACFITDSISVKRLLCFTSFRNHLFLAFSLMDRSGITKATVAAVIAPDRSSRSTVLLTRRSVNPFKGCWCLPGGHIDAAETALAAVEREVAEETGLEFIDPLFLTYCDEIFPEYGFHAVAVCFYGIGHGTLRLMPDEVEQISWFPLHEALKQPLAFNHLQILQYYAQHLPQ